MTVGRGFESLRADQGEVMDAINCVTPVCEILADEVVGWIDSKHQLRFSNGP